MIDAARPWPRFFARFIDVGLVSLVFGLFAAIFAPTFYDKFIDAKGNDAGIAFLAMLFLVPVEAISLAMWGTTAGKATFGISIAKTDGSRLTVCEALRRSYLVWLKGAGCGLPLINLITCGVAYNKLKKTGSTTWDSKLDLSVFQVKLSTTRMIVSGGLLVGLVALIIIGSLA